MALRIVISYGSGFLFAFLISSASFSLLPEATASADTDVQQDDYGYGVDMFPEKSFDPKMVGKVFDADSESQAHAESDSSRAEAPLPSVSKEESGNNSFSESHPADFGCSSNCSDGLQSGDDQGQVSLQQMMILVARQQTQLEQLEHLTVKLQHIMEKLENATLGPSGDAIGTQEKPFHPASSDIKEASSPPIVSLGSSQNEVIEKEQEGKATKMISEEGPGTSWKKPGYDPKHVYSNGMTIARYKPAWSEHFQFLSAVKIDGEVTCLHVLPHEGEEGLSRYVAVGVNTGRVYIFMTHGDLLVDFRTISGSPISAMLSFALRRNESLFLTGHLDGTVLVHKIWETTHGGSMYGEDWHMLSMEHIQALTAPGTQGNSVSHDTGDTIKESDAVVKEGTLKNSVKILEVYRVGKMRYILASDSDGNIQVFRENGTFYGSAKAPSQPLAFVRSPNSQRLLFLTRDGAASLDLRSLAVRSGSCEGLNGTKVVGYTFDATGRSKAYGFTDEGDMVYMAITGDSLHFECHVRSKRKFQVGGHVMAQGIKGYLLVATPLQVFVYNTTSHVGSSHNSIPVGAPRFLFAVSMEEIVLSFLSGSIRSSKDPVVACNRDRLVVLAFGDGYVGMYKSLLLVQKAGNFNSRAWGSPIIIFVLMLLGGWHFLGKKRDVSGPMNDSDVTLASSSMAMSDYATRAGLDERRDTLDIGRYKGPSKAFSGGGAGAYSSGTLSFRGPGGGESSFRAVGETPFMGSSLEPTLRSSSLEPHMYLKREAADPNFMASKLESSFQSPITDSSTFLKRGLDLKPARVISSLQPRVKSLQEPNSF